MPHSKLTIEQFLSRGLPLSDEELSRMCLDLTNEKLDEMQRGTRDGSLDQPVKVVPREGMPKATMSGYFTQEKFIVSCDPRTLERVLGIYGKLKNGAYILAPISPLMVGDYLNKAYTYVPEGKPFENPDERVYRPGTGAPQWQLTRPLQARVIAQLAPDEPYARFHAPLQKMTIRVAELDQNVKGPPVSERLQFKASPVGGAQGMVRSSGFKAHAGWDLYANIGSPAYAVGWGEVASVLKNQDKSKESYGNYIALQLRSQEANTVAKAFGVKYIYAFYAHLSAIQVKEGDSVWLGQKIGNTGNTGNACNTPPHLHFEMRTKLRWEKGHPLQHTIDPGYLLGWGYYTTKADQNSDPYL